ncbi:ABC transporter ATP-binding protein [Prosthecomicrobium hirschii]|uniref:ABC transporter ATP-binding protein n=1 Tax=Prosthecodimorpha hirschii TaxID=665126 RepID=UPI00112E3AFB|nr:ATP-binding cassette domain-containing protein [Prosthecomicrobium hirschii]MCW1843632.1 ATP-binding cassette domain-containing protein [Prosthecomicrobium hirschii]TPQ52008.1 ABC transporter ATP-binding protein [Prosthecomicrobium hirschii]
MSAPILSLSGVTKSYPRGGMLGSVFGARAPVLALDDVSLDVMAGDVVGIVGESGSGKSTLAQLAVGLTRPTAGTIRLGGEDLGLLMRDHAGPWRRRIQMAFQDSSSALNPRKSIGRCLEETLVLAGVDKAARPAEAAALLGRVGLGAEMLPRLPHELSGGQRQRVGLARALAMKPDVLIADEPVSALDVSLQAQVINLLGRLTGELGLTLLFISHDLALVRALCRRVIVMRKGRIVEQGPCLQVLESPRDDYTRLLLSAVPKGIEGRRRPPARTSNPEFPRP